MLTDSELQWLGNRGQWRYHSCRWCHAFSVASKQIGPSPCVQKCRKDKKHPFCYGFRFNIFREAAEFEARVAAKLAERCVLLEKVVQKTLGVAEYINLSAAAENVLKTARLQVEEEMDAD